MEAITFETLTPLIAWAIGPFTFVTGVMIAIFAGGYGISVLLRSIGAR